MSDPDATAHGDAPASPPPPSSSLATGGAGEVPPAARQRTRWPRWLVVFLVVMALLVGGAFYAAHKTVNYYVITPGDATPVSQYIEVPPAYRHHETGTILLTDVFVTSLNALNYLRYKYLDSNNQIVPGSELLGPTVDPQQYLDQGYLEMAQAQDNATVTALRHLGYVVTSTPSGALVYGIEPGTPADRTLQVGQVITGVNGAATPSGCALVRALHGLSPGTTVALSVQQNTISDTGRVVPGPVVDKQVRLAKPPRGVTGGTCGISAPPTAFLGIDPEDQLDWHFPVHVTVHTADIGGPSAGLAMALGIMTSSARAGSRVTASWPPPGRSTRTATCSTWEAWPRRRSRSSRPGPPSSSCPRWSTRRRSPRPPPSSTSTAWTTSTRCCRSSNAWEAASRANRSRHQAAP